MLVDTNIMIIIIIMIIIFIIIIHHLSVTLFLEKSKALLIFTFANNVLYLEFFQIVQMDGFASNDTRTTMIISNWLQT